MDILHATILVLVVTNQRILLAADSRKTYIDKQGVQRTDTIDKIYKTNECYYAVSGFHEEEGSFSIHKLIHDGLAHVKNFQEAVKQLAHTLATSLKQYFRELKVNSPALFQQVKRVSFSGGEVFIVGRINTVPTAFLLEYSIREEASIKVVMNTWSIDINAIADSRSCYWRAIGNTPVLIAGWLSESDWALYSVENARSLIEEGSKRFPLFVSLPVNILELTKEGVSWIERTPSSPNTINDDSERRAS